MCHLRSLALGTILTLSSLGFCQSMAERSGWFLSGAANFGQDIIGSEDTRRGGWYSVGVYRPEKRLAIRGLPAQLHIEGFAMFTKGGGFDGMPVDTMQTYGVLATARYWPKVIRNLDTYVDLSFGVAYNSRSTVDLDHRLNTTPSIGGGFGWRLQECDVLLGVRFYHMSNGGTRGNNQGSNNIQYVLTVRF